MREELKNLRKTCLQMAHAGKDGNLQSVFSSLEILWMLYNRVMNWSPAKARDPERDYFLISKRRWGSLLFCRRRVYFRVKN